MNLYGEIIESNASSNSQLGTSGPDQAKNNATLYGCPGRHLLVDLTGLDAAAHPVRGIWSGGGRLFVAAGTKFMELNSAYAVVGSIATIADDATHTPVTILANGNQLFVVASGLAYCNNGTGLVPISIPALSGKAVSLGTLLSRSLLPNSSTGNTDYFDVGMVGQTITYNGNPYTVLSVTNPSLLTTTASMGVHSDLDWSATPAMTAGSAAFLDGFFIVSRPQTRQFNWSNLYDGSTWAGLNFAYKESAADAIQSVFTHNEQLLVFGTNTAEVWATNTDPGTLATFQRLTGAAAKYGSISAWSPCEVHGKVYYIGGGDSGQCVAYRLDGFTPTRISTHAEESAWNTAGLGVNCVSYSYLEEGHWFWVINFGSQTWVWDATANFWHQRAQWSGAAFTAYATKYHTWIVNAAGSANAWGNGKHITGGSLDGILYESSVNFYDDNGADLAWRRAIPYRYSGGNQLFFGRMTLEAEMGTVVSGAAPTVTRDYSDDRGNTFVNPQTAALGIHAAVSVRAFWPTGGSSRGRVWRYFGSGQYKVALIDLQCEEIPGTA